MTVKIIRLRLKHDPSNPKEFKLGLGPCGRTVLGLSVNMEPHGVFISQLCEDSLELNTAAWDTYREYTKKLTGLNIPNRLDPPAQVSAMPDGFFFPMEQVLECRIYQTDQPEVCAIKEPNA